MLAAEELTVEGAGRPRLSSVSLAARAGEVLALLGPNGAGKSTLLRCLSGELRPSRGEVLLHGRPLHAWDPGGRARTLAVLPQHGSLAFPFTAEEVVLLGRTPHCAGRPRASDRQLAAEALRRCGAEALAGRPYPRLSGGERARVQLARVLAQVLPRAGEPAAPRALLLDEPLASLDVAQGRAVLDLVQQLAGEGFAVVLSVHDLGLALRHATRVALLRAGELLAWGRPAAVLDDELLSRTFSVPVRLLRHPDVAGPLVVAGEAAPDSVAAPTARAARVALPAAPRGAATVRMASSAPRSP